MWMLLPGTCAGRPAHRLWLGGAGTESKALSRCLEIQMEYLPLVLWTIRTAHALCRGGPRAEHRTLPRFPAAQWGMSPASSLGWQVWCSFDRSDKYRSYQKFWGCRHECLPLALASSVLLANVMGWSCVEGPFRTLGVERGASPADTLDCWQELLAHIGCKGLEVHREPFQHLQWCR